MGTPEGKTVSLNGAEIATLQRNLAQAIEDQKRIEAYIAELKAKIQKKMGDADVLKINGVVAYTWAPTKSFAWARFATDYPQIAENYKIQVTKETLDTEQLLRDHPGLVAPYRSRQFLVK